MPVPRRTRLSVACASVLVALVLLCGLGFVVHMRRMLAGLERQVASGHQLAFRYGPFQPAEESGFVPLVASPDFRSGAVVGGRVFLCGPGELLAFGGDGVQTNLWRAGLELPATSLGPVLAVRLHGALRTQLVVGTDGAGVLVIDPDSGHVAQMLPENSRWRNVTALAALADGDLIVGTREAGVLVFNGETLSSYRPELAKVAVTALLTSAGGLWVGTQNDGLYRAQGGTTLHVTAGLPDPHIESLAQGEGRIFAGTPDGVAEFEDGQLVRTLAKGVFAHALSANGRLLTIAALEGGTAEVPLGTAHGAGVEAEATAEGQTEQFLQVPGVHATETYAVRADGLYGRRGAMWTRVLARNAATLTDRDVSALAFAPDGKLWIGYFDRGLDLVNVATGTAQHLENDRLFCINRIARDPGRDTMAVATANGLVLFDRAGGPRQVMGRRDGLLSEHVTDVTFGRDTMTVATPAGLSFVGPQGVESLYAFQGLVNNHVYAVAGAPGSDELVAGTLGGVSLLQRGTVLRNLTVGNSKLRHHWITAVLPLPAFAGRGYLLGTYGGGLMRMTASGEVEATSGAAEDLVISTNALLATETHVYAGSMGRGLWVYGRASQHWQQVTAGLPSLDVTALAARDGELYVGTDNGLVHVTEARLPL